MGECFLWIPATGEIILDIPPTDQTFATPQEADPYSVVNGGPAVLTLGQKG